MMMESLRSYKKDDIYNYPKKDIFFRTPLKILVIGGAGYIGSVLIEKLYQKNMKLFYSINLFIKISIFKKNKHKNLKIINGDSCV